MILGLQAGFRISEYAQSHSSIHMSLNEKYATNLNGSSKAFICSDFLFTSSHKRLMSATRRSIASFIHITWCFQKNNQNGKVIPFAHNQHDIKFCSVRAAYRITRRTERLKLRSDLPIAVTVSPNGQRLGVSFITSAFISKQLKLDANKAHGISAKDDLKKFDPHSPRVGACILLHQLKKPADFIKKRL